MCCGVVVLTFPIRYRKRCFLVRLLPQAQMLCTYVDHPPHQHTHHNTPPAEVLHYHCMCALPSAHPHSTTHCKNHLYLVLRHTPIPNNHCRRGPSIPHRNTTTHVACHLVPSEEEGKSVGPPEGTTVSYSVFIQQLYYNLNN